jgi:hypothetical protein
LTGGLCITPAFCEAAADLNPATAFVFWVKGLAPHRTLYRGHRLGHSIGSPTTTLPSATSNGNATKYVIPAMAHLTLFGCFSARSEGVWPVSKYLKQET